VEDVSVPYVELPDLAVESQRVAERISALLNRGVRAEEEDAACLT
jgi:hypothetical protein